MPQSEKLLSTQEFAKKAGVSAGTVSKWLRSGKINGSKQGGKWMIAAGELNGVGGTKTAASKKKTPAKSSIAQPKPQAQKTRPSGKTFTIGEFSAMTYLTEYGVQKYIKEGKLIISRDASGQPCIDAANLENTSIKHLIRH